MNIGLIIGIFLAVLITTISNEKLKKEAKKKELEDKFKMKVKINKVKDTKKE